MMKLNIRLILNGVRQVYTTHVLRGTNTCSNPLKYMTTRSRQFHTFICLGVRGIYAYDTTLPPRTRRRRSAPESAEDSSMQEQTAEELQVSPDDTLASDVQQQMTTNITHDMVPKAEHPLKLPNRKLLKNILDDAASFEKVPPVTPDDVWSSGHYPPAAVNVAAAAVGSEEKEESRLPSLNPEKTTIILFPGQGAQFPGMGKSLLNYPNVKRMYRIASEILEYDLLNVCLNGDKRELSRTIYCQPATVVTSLAALEKLREDAPHVIENCTATAGFSVGEITSLIFAGALSFEDGIKLVRIRAEAMQAASEMAPGGMMTLFYGADGRVGFACKAARDWCEQENVESADCEVANYLYTGCRVISGHDKALNFIARNAQDFKIRRIKHLQVGGAFHSRMMQPAKDVVSAAVDKIYLANPQIPVFMNVDGKPYKNAAIMKRLLVKQICSPVKWEQTMQYIYKRSQGSRFPFTYECGPGRTLQTILQKINMKASERSRAIEV